MKIKKVISVVLLLLILTIVFAGCAPAVQDEDATFFDNMLPLIGMVVLMIGVFYFFIMRPEGKKKKAALELRSSLSVGDDIITIGGIMGKIVHLTDDTITFETSEDRVRVQIAKWAISNRDVAGNEAPMTK